MTPNADDIPDGSLNVGLIETPEEGLAAFAAAGWPVNVGRQTLLQSRLASGAGLGMKIQPLNVTSIRRRRG